MTFLKFFVIIYIHKGYENNHIKEGMKKVMPPLIDLTGQKFNYLTVLKRAEKNINNRPAWECQCDCGNICIVKGSELKN